MSLGFPLDSYGVSVGFCGISLVYMISLLDFYGISMRLLCFFFNYDNSRGFLWEFYGVSIKFLWDFYGGSKIFLWDFYWIPEGLHCISLIFL